MNCATCGEGNNTYVFQTERPTRCWACGGDPDVKGSAPPGWELRLRAEYVSMFGPRLPGDEALVLRFSSSSAGGGDEWRR